METTKWSMISQGENFVREDMLMTYSEEEKQENMINRENAKALFSPEFVPLYIEYLDRLTMTECALYGFIRFYKKNNPWRMYFTNDQLWYILKCSPDTISRSISNIEKLWLIKTSRKIKSNWWQIRFIESIQIGSYDADSTFPTSQTRQNLQDNKNNINNILYIKNIPELKSNLSEEEINLYRHELYIIWVMMKLWYFIKHEVKDGVSPNLTIIENFIWLKTMLSRYIPRKEDWKLDRNKAKAETDDRFIYWKNPPKWKKSPTNFQLSLTNWMKPKQRKK